MSIILKLKDLFDHLFSNLLLSNRIDNMKKFKKDFKTKTEIKHLA